MSKSKGGVTRKRSLVRLDKRLISVLHGEQTYSAYLVIDNPIGVSEVTAAKVKASMGRLVAFMLASGYMDKLLNGEP